MLFCSINFFNLSAIKPDKQGQSLLSDLPAKSCLVSEKSLSSMTF